MASPSFSYLTKTLLGIFLVSLILTPTLLRAQEQDYTEEDYKVYQDIQAEKDAAKKADAILKFLRENKTSLRTYAAGEFQKIIIEAVNQKNWNHVIALCEKYLDVMPSDTVAIGAMTEAYSATNNLKGFVTFGEKAYASKPNGLLALRLAQSHLRLNNEAKFFQWADKGLASDPGNLEILTELIRRYMAINNMPQALKYSKTTIKELPTAKKPEGVDIKAWEGSVNNTYHIAYAVIGQNAYQNRNYPEAIINLENATKYNKRNDGVYLQLGESYRQRGKTDIAMVNYAKAYIIKGPMMGTAKKALEQQWLYTHRNSLTGLDQYIQRIQQTFK
jgi:tetratricopeptide (TPR) repeat protein